VNHAAAILAIPLSALLAASCGTQEPPPKTARAHTETAAAPQTSQPPAPATATAPAARPASQTPPGPEKPQSSEQATPKVDEFTPVFEKVLALERDGEFFEAMKLCRDMRVKFGDHPRSGELIEISGRLRDAKRAAAQLRYAIGKLASERADVVKVASKELTDAGPVGAILLRKAVDNDNDRIAIEATRLLAQKRDKQAPAAFVARLAKTPKAKLSAALCTALKQTQDALAREDAAALYAIVRDDAEQKRIDVADLLCSIFEKRCGGDAAKLVELVGHDDALATLKAYVTRALQSGDAAREAWAEPRAMLVGCAAAGLHARYYEGQDFGKLFLERLDTQLDYTEKTVPHPGDKAENISARWTGYLLAPRTGTYLFTIESDDGVRFWLDERLLFEDWSMHAAGEDLVSIELTKSAHAFKLEWMNGQGQARIRLSWSGPGFGKRLVDHQVLRTRPWKGMDTPETTKK